MLKVFVGLGNRCYSTSRRVKPTTASKNKNVVISEASPGPITNDGLKHTKTLMKSLNQYNKKVKIRSVTLRNRRSLRNPTQKLQPIPTFSRASAVVDSSEFADTLETKIINPKNETPSVVPLAHNLDRVLFNPGVHVLKDVRTGVYNFNPFLEKIAPLRDIDFTKLPEFVPGSKDNTLGAIAKAEGVPFYGSTSSLTAILSHFHFLLSANLQPQTMGLSKYFKNETTTFTKVNKKPASVMVAYNAAAGAHSIQSFGYQDQKQILSILGTALEALITTKEEDFKNNYLKRAPGEKDEIKNSDTNISPQNAYHYTRFGDLLIRSQLDCYDSRLPGSGVFDLKTRAVCAVRHDLDYVQLLEGSDYQLSKLDGWEESYSREWFELIRSTLFKYSLQARMGRMDGVFLAFHNVRQLFGFEYIPLSVMDAIFHTGHLLNSKTGADQEKTLSTTGPIVAEKEFRLSINMLTNTLLKLVDKASYNLVFFNNEKSPGEMYIAVKKMKNCKGTGNHDKNNLLSAMSIPEIARAICAEESEEVGNSLQSTKEIPTEDMLSSVDVYCLSSQSMVNGKHVSKHLHPYVTSQDKWTCSATLSKLDSTITRPALLAMFKEAILADDREITSSPNLIQLDEATTEKRLKEGLPKIPAPTPFQQRLRDLSKAGKLSADKSWKEINGRQVSKRPIVWEPKERYN